MKQYHLLLAASGLILASCAEDLTPDRSPASNTDGQMAMNFNLRTGNMTRVDETQLETATPHFGVWAFKGDATTPASMGAAGNTIMENYFVGHSGTYNPTGIVEAGTYVDWWYEGLGNADTYTRNPASLSNNAKQYLKYWDLGKNYTAFFAYAPYIQGPTATPTLTFDATNGKAKLEFKQTVAMGTGSPTLFAGQIEKNSEHANGQNVPLLFSRLTSQIQLAVYEAIPGYHVQLIDADFVREDGTTITSNLPIVAFPADYDAIATPKYTRGEIVFEGKPVVEFDLGTTEADKGSYVPANSGHHEVTVSYNDVVKHGKETDAYMQFNLPTTNLVARVVGGEELYLSDDRTKAAPSPTVYNVIPNNGTTLAPGGVDATNSGIQVVFNFKLVSDDTGEVITVKNARGYVPAGNTQWSANTRYTYIFKITKDVKGTTTNVNPSLKPDDPGQALYPIIFDDVQVEAIQEETYGDWPVSNP